MTRLVRWAFLLAVLGAMVATVPAWSSNNLLPRRCCLHLAGLTALWLGARARWQWGWGLFAGNLVLVWGLSPAREASLPGLLDWGAMLAVVLGLSGARFPRRALLRVLALTGAVGALVGLAQQWWPFDWWGATRPAGLFASRDTAAVVVVAAVPLALLAMGRHAASLTLVMGAEGAFLLSTRARAAWVAGALAWAALWRVVPRWRRVVLGSAVLGVVAGAWLTPGPRLRWTSGQPYGDSLKSLASAQLGDRVELWTAAARQILHRPWGFGPGAFPTSFASSLTGVDVEAPHNLVLSVVYAVGLQGACLLAFLLLRTARRTASSRTQLLRTALLAVFVAGLTGKVLEDPPSAIFAVSVVGLLFRHRSHGAGRWRGPFVLALAAAVTLLDSREVWSSYRMSQAYALEAAGDLRQAYAVAEEALPSSHVAREWVWMVELVSASGDRPRCASWASRGLARFPQHPRLLALQLECSQS